MDINGENLYCGTAPSKTKETLIAPPLFYPIDKVTLIKNELPAVC